MRADEEDKAEWERELDFSEVDSNVVDGIRLTGVVARARVREHRLEYGPRYRKILVCLILPKVKVSAARYPLPSVGAANRCSARATGPSRLSERRRR